MMIHGISGIYTKGEGSTDLMLCALDDMGHSVNDIDIPNRTILMSYFDSINKRDATIVCDEVMPGDAIIAHSRGCLVAWHALKLGAQVSQLFLFAPAMEPDTVFPCYQVQEIHIIHNPLDRAIHLGRLLLFRHPFGAMGQVGYEGPPDPRVVECEAVNRAPMTLFRQHTETYFGAEHLQSWAQYVDSKIRGFEERQAA